MIQPISDASLLGAAANSSYDAARTSAEEKSFQATLDELRRKAEAAHSSAAADPAVGYVPKKSNAIKIFEDMRDTELMNAAAKSGGIGLADMMYKQLSPTVIKK